MNFNLTRFKTLMLREWMQNRWTWAVVVLLLPVLVLVTLPFGTVDFDKAQPPPKMIAGIAIALGMLSSAMLAWAAVLFMATNLARRDVQDRSIEFWLSLPSTHTEHLGAQYLMHALVFPVAALLVGLTAGLLIAPMVLFKWMGMEAVMGADWGAVLSWVGAMLLPSLFGLVLAAFWLSPVVLGLMALSAWVKRLALPVIVVVGTFLGNLPATSVAFRAALGDYGQRVGQLVEGAVALFASMGPALMRKEMNMPPVQLADYFSTALGNLASTAFAVSIGIALISAMLLMKRRARGG
jgi:hypothetical protein